MKRFLKLCASVAGAGFAAACCLGVTGALSVLTAIGAGFLASDVLLLPLYLGLLALSVWLLYASTRSHGNLAPFWTGLGGALAAFAGLWVLPALVYAGLIGMVASGVWDLLNARSVRDSPR